MERCRAICAVDASNDVWNVGVCAALGHVQEAAFLGSNILGIGVAGNLGGSIEGALLGCGMLSIIVSCASVYGGWKIAMGITR